MNTFLDSLMGVFNCNNICQSFRELDETDISSIWSVVEKPENWDDYSDLEIALFFRNNARNMFSLKQ